MSPRDAATVQLVLPGWAEYLQVVRLATGGVAARAGLSVDEIEDLKVAVGEACTNVIDHAFDSDTDPADRRITLRMTVRNNEMTVEVEDEGKGFDPAELARERRNGVEGEGGLGFWLMEELTDSLRVESAPGSGTRVIMVKRASR
ncbi:MAG: ATP-binding protein [Armatimonadota bacterium]